MTGCDYLARDYQVRCGRAIDDEHERVPSTMAVLATGLGKTVIVAHAARRRAGRVMVVAHRDELIRQAVDKLGAVTGEAVGVEMGPERVDERSWMKPRLVVSSVQTLCRERRRAKYDPGEFGLLVIDEAHHAVARSYRQVIDHFRGNAELRVLGVTATPKRADRLAMGQVFDSVCFDYGIEPAVEDGWLVPVRQQAVHVQGLDFSSVRSVAGDFHEGELERIVSEEKVLHRTVAPLVELAGDLPTLVFCVSVAHARLVAAVIDRYKGGAAAWLSGDSNPDERRATVERFKRGDVQYLVNCSLFLEGFDAPNTAVVAMARPTKSLALFAQMLGRGTRPLPGVVDGPATAEARREAIAASAKPNMLVLDFVGNSGQHRIITAADLLGGKYGTPVREYARKTVESEKKAVPVEESLARAKDELALLDEIRERRRREAIRARAEFAAEEVSPFGGGLRAKTAEANAVPQDPPTPGQVWFLVNKLGWREDAARRLNKRQAGGIIGKSRRA